MSKKHYRKDKTCLNCKFVVENKFCPNCGQENYEEHKSFHHLFFHFFEDLTHYENSFWKTIRMLLFKPGFLTKEYLSGKRMTYLAPVRLYIFVSFATFLGLAIIPNTDKTVSVNLTPKKESKIIEKEKVLKNQENKIISLQKKNSITKNEANSILNYINSEKIKVRNNETEGYYVEKEYNSLKELDSVEARLPENEKKKTIQLYFRRKIQKLQDELNPKEFNSKFEQEFTNNIPKAIFIYMPLFALLLWLFESRKKWYYFDHGIFTLHYFSLLLLSILLVRIWSSLLELLPSNLLFKITSFAGQLIIVVYALYYFFSAHKKFYNQKWSKSVLKGFIMFFINIILLSFLFFCITIFSVINLH